MQGLVVHSLSKALGRIAIVSPAKKKGLKLLNVHPSGYG